LELVVEKCIQVPSERINLNEPRVPGVHLADVHDVATEQCLEHSFEEKAFQEQFLPYLKRD
jgi:hypothetical protein